MGTIELKISTTELKIGPIFKHICQFYLVSISLLVDNEVVNAVFQILWGVSDTVNTYLSPIFTSFTPIFNSIVTIFNSIVTIFKWIIPHFKWFNAIKDRFNWILYLSSIHLQIGTIFKIFEGRYTYLNISDIIENSYEFIYIIWIYIDLAHHKGVDNDRPR